MKPINDFANVKERGGAIENLPAGGYICRIEKCEEKPNKSGAGTHLEILFDIIEGDYKGWFSADWQTQEREDKFWRGIINQNVPDEDSPKYDMQCGFFKRFTNDLEKSNPDYHWDWNEAGLKGKRIGIVFGEVEKQSQRGTRYMITRADSITSTDAIEEGKFKIPAPKMLTANTVGTPVSITIDENEDLPF